MVKQKLAIGVQSEAIWLAASMRDELKGGAALQLSANLFCTMCVLTGQDPKDLNTALSEGTAAVEQYFKDNPDVFGEKGEG